MDCNSYSYTAPGFGVDAATIARYSNDDMYITYTIYDGHRHIVSAYSYDGQLDTYDEFRTEDAARKLYNHITANYADTPPIKRELNKLIRALHREDNAA